MSAPKRRDARPHLVLISVDALRGDCVLGGRERAGTDAPRPVTPALDALFAESLAFPNAMASSSWTKPSVPSMLLSRHPSEHGVLEVAKGSRRGAFSATLPDEVPTLAEVLKGAGYRTVGLAHNAQLDPCLGFARGFDHYTCEAGSGDEIVDRLRELDPFAGGGPAFVWLHLLEPHWPYRGRISERAERVAAGRFAFHRWRAARWKELKRELKAGTTTLEPAELEFLRTVYALAVEEADRAIGRALDWLRERGVLERSLVVATADHGEELLERGVVGHGQSLHAELVDVPLLLRRGRDAAIDAALAPGACPAPVGHVDLLPTLADAAGLDAPAGAAGTSLLVPDALPADRLVFAEVKHKRRYHQAVRDARFKLVRRWRFGKAPGGKTANGDYNNLAELFADRSRQVETALYDLAADPGEREDLAAKEPAERERLERALDAWWESVVPAAESSRDLEDELIRRLEALGYL